MQNGNTETIAKGKIDQSLVKKTSSRLFYPIIVNSLFIIGGILFLSRVFQNPQILDIALGPVAVILLSFTTLTKPMINDKDRYNTLAFSIWIIISYMITIQADKEILFILILIGFLVIQELSQEQLTQRYQRRLNIILVFFLMVFVVIVADKIHIILAS